MLLTEYLTTGYTQMPVELVWTQPLPQGQLVRSTLHCPSEALKPPVMLPVTLHRPHTAQPPLLALVLLKDVEASLHFTVRFSKEPFGTSLVVQW